MALTLHDPRPTRDRLAGPGEIDHHVGDMTATASADVTLGEVQERLAQAQQWLPIDGGSGETLGELVLRNSSGPLRLGYGAWRDLLLGVQFTNGRGERVTAGGRTVKNVAGYDLTKFLVGSFGCFGTPETLTFRTYRRPFGGVIAVFEPAYQTLLRLLPGELRPTWAALSSDGLACGYLGDERAVGFYRQTLRQYAAPEPASVTPIEFSRDVEVRASLWRAGQFRLSLPPAEVWEAMRQIAPRRWVADAAHGIVVGETDRPETLDAAEEAARKLGGTAWVAEAGADRPRRLAFSSPTAKLVARIKEAFDPDRALPPVPMHLLS